MKRLLIILLIVALALTAGCEKEVQDAPATGFQQTIEIVENPQSPEEPAQPQEETEEADQ